MRQCSINQLLKQIKDYELQSIDSLSNKSIAESEARKVARDLRWSEIKCFQITFERCKRWENRIDRGSEFHTVGAQTRKAHWPMHVRVRGWVSRHWSDDLSKRGGTYDVMSDLRFAGWFSESNLYVSVSNLNLIRAWMGSQCRLTRICWMGERQSLRASLAARFWTR